MDHFGPFWSRVCQNPVRDKVISTKTILDHFGPAHLPTVPRPLRTKTMSKFYPQRFGTPSACYRGPKPQLPKVVRRGCKRCLYVDQKPAALVRERVTLVQNGDALVQETLGRSFLQLAKTPLNPLLTTLGSFEVSGLCSRHSGSQAWCPKTLSVRKRSRLRSVCVCILKRGVLRRVF